MLPERSTAAEDALIASLDDDDFIVDVVRAALAAGRPRLAGRAVQLLGRDCDDPEVERARRAASMLLLTDRPDPVELDRILEGLRGRLVRRASSRARRALKGELSPKPWKRRRR
ncbi:MAG: hypothetical protein GY913_22400 [Proteobacteria bacterium]|nr:hypothetical protein [Pseudomonadota bacterium]MCP4919661.1 hypothetical protein [Pseudomonadota bacterium]